MSTGGPERGSKWYNCRTMAKQKSLDAYEERYRLVFAAGALYWNDPRPNPNLMGILSQMRAGSRCIEFGCGEGYQAELMASGGHSVTAIDLSPTAIARARQRSQLNQLVDYRVGDVTDGSSLSLVEASYDLAIDIGCLHMMVEDEDRGSYLSLARRVLKTGGRFFLQEGLDLDDVSPSTAEEARELADTRALAALPRGTATPRTIMTADGTKEVALPLCASRMLILQGYVRELESHGFRIVSARRAGGANTAYEAIIFAERP